MCKYFVKLFFVDLILVYAFPVWVSKKQKWGVDFVVFSVPLVVPQSSLWEPSEWDIIDHIVDKGRRKRKSAWGNATFHIANPSFYANFFFGELVLAQS